MKGKDKRTTKNTEKWRGLSQKKTKARRKENTLKLRLAGEHFEISAIDIFPKQNIEV
jgi:hypothetical protein